MRMTTIQVSDNTLKRMKKNKIVNKESYDEQINRLISGQEVVNNE